MPDQAIDDDQHRVRRELSAIFEHFHDLVDGDASKLCYLAVLILRDKIFGKDDIMGKNNFVMQAFFTFVSGFKRAG